MSRQRGNDRVDQRADPVWDLRVTGPSGSRTCRITAARYSTAVTKAIEEYVATVHSALDWPQRITVEIVSRPAGG